MKDICRRHLREVKARISTAAKLSDDGALDDLHVIVDAIGRALRDTGVDGLKYVGPAHAAARDGQAFAFGEVFEEYVLLRRNVRDNVRARLGRALREDEVELLQSAIDAVVCSTLVSLATQREGRARLESKALGDFLASMAHDLRNEISGALTALNLIEESGRDLEAERTGGKSEKLEHLSTVLADVREARAAMESTVAAMTRILDAEKNRHLLAVRRTEVDVLPLLEGVARSAERQEIARRLAGEPSRIVVRCEPRLLIFTDPDLLSTILTNLLGNAVKYARAGSIILEASSSGEKWRFAVIDEGPGMAEADIGRLFHNFERLGRTDSEGFGLGLFVARRAAALLGTAIEVQSVLGQGTTFSFTITR